MGAFTVWSSAGHSAADEEAWARADRRAADAARAADDLAAARTGDGYCQAAARGYPQWQPWLPSETLPYMGDADEWASHFEWRDLVGERQTVAAMRATDLDAHLWAEWASSGWVSGGYKAFNRAADAALDAARAAPAKSAAPEAPINNPFAALAALKGKL